MMLGMLEGVFGSRGAGIETLKEHHNETAKSNEQAALARRFDFGS
jgi:hypothetical protein